MGWSLDKNWFKTWIKIGLKLEEKLVWNMNKNWFETWIKFGLKFEKKMAWKIGLKQISKIYCTYVIGTVLYSVPYILYYTIPLNVWRFTNWLLASHRASGPLCQESKLKSTHSFQARQNTMKITFKCHTDSMWIIHVMFVSAGQSVGESQYFKLLSRFMT